MPEETKKEYYSSMNIHIDHYGEDNEYTWSVHVKGCVGKHDPQKAMEIAGNKLTKAIEAATGEL